MLTLFGATGYTGRFCAHYLRDHAPAELEWAIAGRNPDKLERVRAELGAAADRVRVIVADSDDPASIDAMVAQSSAVISTAGPFALYGTPLVEACVRHGVHYADITGETPWVRDMIDAYHDTAAAAGTRIVPMCGMDSVPADIGARFVVDHIRDALGQGTRAVRAAYKVKGGFSGGTIASALNMGASGQTRRLADPVLLNPDAHRTPEDRAANRDRVGVRFDEDLGWWTAPFVMAAVNTRAVRRSAALEAEWGEPYGPRFDYQESMRARSRLQAGAIAAGLGVFAALTTTPPGRALVRALAPEPGEGPSEEQLASGFLHCRYVGEAEDGTKVLAEMKAAGDPGYRVTVMMLCEAGLTLALEGPTLPGGAERGGVLTPATALGDPYVERMRRAGLELRVG